MATAFPELNLKLSAQRWACVLDPALALSRHGLMIARQMGDVVQLWLVRELWHILDSSEFFVQHPEALTAERRLPHKLKWAIEEWDRVRMESNLAGFKLYWIGDGLSESALPDGADAGLLKGYEQLACSLNRRIHSVAPITSAMRDAAALAAALGTPFVLSFNPKDEDVSTLPPICSALQSWDIPCRQIDAEDPIAAIEREHLRHLFVHSGLSHLMWADLRLAVVRLLLPNAPLSLPGPPAAADDLPEVESMADQDPPSADLWEAAQAFWHPI